VVGILRGETRGDPESCLNDNGVGDAANLIRLIIYFHKFLECIFAAELELKEEPESKIW
jgi:hypothetical protein